MSQQQLGLSFILPAAITASQEATNHPATNVGLFTKFRRTARSTTLASPWTITVDFGATTSLPGFFLNNANFSAILFASSPNNSTWTELGGLGLAVPLDDRLATRRKVWVPSSSFSSAFNARYLRIQCVTPDSGATYFELGALAFPSPVSSMTRNFAPPRWTIREPLTRLDYPGGGGEVNVEGVDLLSFDLAFGPNFTDAMAQQLALRAVGQGMPFFYYENRGDPSHAYILKRMAEPTFSEQFRALAIQPWSFLEAV